MSVELQSTESNASRLTREGVALDHMSDSLLDRLNELSADDVQTLVDLKRRFKGDLALDPTMYWGSGEF